MDDTFKPKNIISALTKEKTIVFFKEYLYFSYLLIDMSIKKTPNGKVLFLKEIEKVFCLSNKTLFQG